MASTIASTLALSRPSEKLGTHSTSVDMDIRIPIPCRAWLGTGRPGRRASRKIRPVDSNSQRAPARSARREPGRDSQAQGGHGCDSTRYNEDVVPGDNSDRQIADGEGPTDDPHLRQPFRLHGNELPTEDSGESTESG